MTPRALDGSEPEREDVCEGVVPDPVCCFPDATVASVVLLGCPVLIAGVTTGLAAEMPAAHGQGEYLPAAATRQAAERAGIEVVDDPRLVDRLPGAGVGLAARHLGAPLRLVEAAVERAPTDLTEATDGDHPFDLVTAAAPLLRVGGVRDVLGRQQLQRVVVLLIEVVGAQGLPAT